MRLHLATAAMAASITLSAFLVGCSTTVTVAPPSGCSTANLVCTQGARGFTCTAGVNPEDEDSSLSCSLPVADGANDDFCCFTFHGSQSTCEPDNTIACPDPSSFGYACAPGDDPTTLDPSLNCSSPAQLSNEDDFCCN